MLFKFRALPGLHPPSAVLARQRCHCFGGCDTAPSESTSDTGCRPGAGLVLSLVLSAAVDVLVYISALQGLHLPSAVLVKQRCHRCDSYNAAAWRAWPTSVMLAKHWCRSGSGLAQSCVLCVATTCSWRLLRTVDTRSAALAWPAPVFSCAGPAAVSQLRAADTLLLGRCSFFF